MLGHLGMILPYEDFGVHIYVSGGRRDESNQTTLEFFCLYSGLGLAIIDGLLVKMEVS